jgi:hypothetical protein
MGVRVLQCNAMSVVTGMMEQLANGGLGYSPIIHIVSMASGLRQGLSDGDEQIAGR